MADRIGDIYSGSAGNWAEQVAARDRIHWLCAQAVGQRILDLGCSQGVVAILLAREGFQTVGVDSDPQVVEQAELAREGERPEVADRLDFRLGDASGLGEPDQAFDTVIMGNLLEDLVQPGRALREARRLLKSTGRLVLSTRIGAGSVTAAVRPLRMAGLLEALEGQFAVEDLVLKADSVRVVCRPGPSDALNPVLDRFVHQAERDHRAHEAQLLQQARQAAERCEQRRQDFSQSQAELAEAEDRLASVERDSAKRGLDLEHRRQRMANLLAVLPGLRHDGQEVGRRLAGLRREADRTRKRAEQVQQQARRVAEAAEGLRASLPAVRAAAREAEAELQAVQITFESLDAERAGLKKLRARFDKLLDRVLPGPGAPSARLERLLPLREKLARQTGLVTDGLRLKIGDAVLRALRPSLDTLALPARLTTLFAEGRHKTARKQTRLNSGVPAGAIARSPAPQVLEPDSEQQSAAQAAVPLLGWPATEPGHRLCVYAEVNPNLIDGSSIWLASLLETLGLDPELRLTVLLGVPVKRPEVIGHLLDHPRIRFVNAEELAGAGWLAGAPAAKRRRLEPKLAVQALAAIDRLVPQDGFIVRGPGIFEGEHVLDRIIERPEIARRTWAYLVDPTAYDRPRRRENLIRAHAGCRRIVCQTDVARRLLMTHLGLDEPERIDVLPPMIPSAAEGPRSLGDGARPRLGYAGKLSPPYRILELVAAFGRVRAERTGAELHVIGDKIHNAPVVEGFEERVRAALNSQPGVIWHGGASRKRTIELLAKVDLASSWRDASFDHSPELSTKVLEYAGLGVPVLLNPTELQRDLFGPGYPGYVESEDDVVRVFLELSADADRYREVSGHVLEVARGFTFENALADLGPTLHRDLAAERALRAGA